jgi:hypothetical protein
MIVQQQLAVFLAVVCYKKMNTLREKKLFIYYTTNTFTTVINIYFSWGEVYLGL